MQENHFKLKKMSQCLIFLLIFIQYCNSIEISDLKKMTPEEIMKIYCHFKCGETNTVCQRKGNCGPINKDCLQLPLKDNFRKLMLDWHNEKRNKIALGLDTRGGNGQSSNMRALSYDLDLEMTAQCRTNNCIYGHDECRSGIHFPGDNGQNLGSGMDVDYVANKDETMLLAEMWYDEITLGKPEVIDSLPRDLPFIHQYGHFSQLLWAETAYIGCGHSFRTTDENYTGQYFLICNFSPPGNRVHHPIYKRGTPCSECKMWGNDVTCNEQYPGLCGRADYNVTDSDGYFNKANEMNCQKKLLLLFGVTIYCLFVK